MDASNLRNHANIGFLYRMNKTITATIDAAIAHVHTFERLLVFATSLCFFSLWTVALSLVVVLRSFSVVFPFFTTFDRMAVCLMLFTPFPPLMVIFPSLSIISSGKSGARAESPKKIISVMMDSPDSALVVSTTLETSATLEMLSDTLSATTLSVLFSSLRDVEHAAISNATRQSAKNFNACFISSQLFDVVQSVHPSGQEPLLCVLQQLLFSCLAPNLLFVCHNGTRNNPIDELHAFFEYGFKKLVGVGKVDRRQCFVANDTIRDNAKQCLRLLDAVDARCPNPIHKDICNLLGMDVIGTPFIPKHRLDDVTPMGIRNVLQVRHRWTGQTFLLAIRFISRDCHAFVGCAAPVGRVVRKSALPFEDERNQVLNVRHYRLFLVLHTIHTLAGHMNRHHGTRKMYWHTARHPSAALACVLSVRASQCQNGVRSCQP
nr:MAG TPA: hypothetical protein [Caudoviricetes sp.]